MLNVDTYIIKIIKIIHVKYQFAINCCVSARFRTLRSAESVLWMRSVCLWWQASCLHRWQEWSMLNKLISDVVTSAGPALEWTGARYWKYRQSTLSNNHEGLGHALPLTKQFNFVLECGIFSVHRTDVGAEMLYYYCSRSDVAASATTNQFI